MKSELQLPFEMPPVRAPSFADRVFDVRDFGAVGDGATGNTEAFRRAIEACHEQGGGLVRIPTGTWTTGPIHLRSNVNLHLAKDALVRFSTRSSDYLPVVFTRWEGTECYNYSPLIYARECENIAITGEGTLDGQGQAWWHWKKLQQGAAKQLYDAEHEGIPVAERVFGTEQAALRPQFFQPLQCRNVLIEGVVFLNGPMWTIHPVYCENVLVRRVTVRTNGPNTDGLNPDSCRNVLVESCSFSTGDDCIAINSGMNEDGWRVGRPCENVVIRDCHMGDGHGGVVIGSGMSGGVRNVYVHGCRFTGGERGIRLKAMRGRGGVVENVHYQGIRMQDIRDEAIVLNLFYGSSTAAPRSQTSPVFREIYLRDIRCEGAGAAVVLRGLPEQPISHIVLEDLSFTAVSGIRCQDVDDLTLSGVSATIDETPLFSCSNVRGLTVTGVTLEQGSRRVDEPG